MSWLVLRSRADYRKNGIDGRLAIPTPVLAGGNAWARIVDPLGARSVGRRPPWPVDRLGGSLVIRPTVLAATRGAPNLPNDSMRVPELNGRRREATAVLAAGGAPCC